MYHILFEQFQSRFGATWCPGIIVVHPNNLETLVFLMRGSALYRNVRWEKV